ncbi:MAG: hypothetical protein KKD44_21710 [Proteobacteria bacterium]|nr:hypothetical protein [Pseudomonadota bacterium]
MEKQIVKKPEDNITVSENKDMHPFFPNGFSMPFVRFSYSRSSMISDGKTTHVTAEEHRFEKGRLDSQRFEGTLAGDYLQHMTQMMENQFNLMIQSINMFLPFK